MLPESAVGTEETGSALPVLKGQYSYASITDKIADLVLKRPTHWGWVVGLGVSFALTLVFVVAIGYLFTRGVGIWGVNVPVVWAFAITSYVWWIAIGMSGTFISAALLLARQRWRTSINRFAEAMTIFAVSIAGLFPILHLGRPWFFYWLAPYPDVMNIWPQWRSPLVWDFFAILAYLILSLLFWYLGLIPDLATLRDRAQKRSRQIIYGLFALGWRGEARHWHRFETAYLMLAGLAVPLVFSVHSVVALDFAAGNTPGWHSTLLPPFFIDGALFSGFSMVLTLAVPMRAVFGLQDLITERHLDNIAKAVLATGLLLAYSYLIDIFIAFYSGNEYEIYTAQNRMFGPYAPVYWATIFCNVVVTQLLWFQCIRLNPLALFIISIIINIGMWLERFMLIVTSLHRDFLPSAWGMFYPTFWDWATLIGSIGFFFILFLLFVRFLPAISVYEMRELVAETEGDKR
jgi:Ni/Fe-hydrogenase subunit HybB-like protein